MYKLLIVDDEQIVLDSVNFIVRNHMGGVLLTETAHSGREAIEKAEEFRPDIVLIDIRMPGISGLDAIAEIQKFNGDALFIVATAYEKFDFAKEALRLGAIDYLNKPLSRAKVISALENAMTLKEGERRRREAELALKERLAFLLPTLESGFIYSLVFADDHSTEMESFRRILDLGTGGGYVMTVEFLEDGEPATGRIGVGVRSQTIYPQLHDALKESCACIVGPLMLNRVLAFVPCDGDAPEYERRLQALQIAEEVRARLQAVAGGNVAIGIGNCHGKLGDAYQSYEESLKALGYASCGGVFHINDTPLERGGSAYPDNAERQLLASVTAGQADDCLRAFDHIFEWLRAHYEGSPQEIAAGLTELIVLLGRIAREYAVPPDGAISRETLREALQSSDINALKTSLKNRIRRLCEQIAVLREKRLSNIILTAKEYIAANYCHDITLEDVSRAVNVSPNYFSRLFKDETGSNFIDYLTAQRMERAKKLLSDHRYASKEICYQIGYSDPNYFSRLFKKIVGVTPTEYRNSFTGTP